MQHLSHFGLRGDPFVNRARASDFVATPVHADAERRLRRAVDQSKALVVLAGEAGVGKTLLARQLLESIDDEHIEACPIVVIPGEGARLLPRLARALGADESGERTVLLGLIFEQLVRVHEAHRHTLVLVDGADGFIAPTDLDDVRALLGFEHEDGALATVVLVGSQTLDTLLDSEPRLRARIEARIVLAPLDRAATSEYVVERLRRAGGDSTCFLPDALDALHAVSLGVPRTINAVADDALYEAAVRGSRSVAEGDVRRAAQSLRLDAGEGDDTLSNVGAAPAARAPVASSQAEAVASRAPRVETSVRAPAASIAGAGALSAKFSPEEQDMTFAGRFPGDKPAMSGDASLLGGFELPDPNASTAVRAAASARVAAPAPDRNAELEGDVLELSQPLLDGELESGNATADDAVVLDVSPGDDDEPLRFDEAFALGEPPKDDADAVDDEEDSLFAGLVIDESR